MNPREQFEIETGKSSLCYSTMVGGFNDDYVEFLEAKLNLINPEAEKSCKTCKHNNMGYGSKCRDCVWFSNYQF